MENGEIPSVGCRTDHDSSANETELADHLLTTGDDLYFLRTAATRHVKIGRAVNVSRRLKNIASGNHEPVALVGVLPAGGWQELVWHELFAHLRVHGEWFAPDATLDRAIAKAIAGERWANAFEDGDTWEMCTNLLDIVDELRFAPPSGRATVRSAVIAYAMEFRDLCRV